MNADKDDVIAFLCSNWLKFKKREADAREARIQAEKDLINAIGFKRDNGSETFNFGPYRAKLTASQNYKIDKERWLEIERKIPDGMKPVKTRIEVDPAGVKFLRENAPGCWMLASRAITSTPAKVGVVITEVEE